MRPQGLGGRKVDTKLFVWKRPSWWPFEILCFPASDSNINTGNLFQTFAKNRKSQFSQKSYLTFVSTTWLWRTGCVHSQTKQCKQNKQLKQVIGRWCSISYWLFLPLYIISLAASIWLQEAKYELALVRQLQLILIITTIWLLLALAFDPPKRSETKVWQWTSNNITKTLKFLEKCAQRKVTTLNKMTWQWHLWYVGN